MSAITAPTKTDIARPVFIEMFKAGTYTRKQIMDEMMKVASLTDNGASTYYANFKKTYEGKGVVVATKVTKVITEAPVEPDFEEMTDIELTMFYVKYSSTPQTDLVTRDDVMLAIIDEVTFA